MPSSKETSGMFSVECKAFPAFSNNKAPLQNKSCHIVEPYDQHKLVSVLIAHIDGGFFVKFLNKDAIHIDPKDAGPLEDQLIAAINFQKLLRLPQMQLFFAINGDEVMLVDSFDGRSFASPGMLTDVYGKRFKVQKTRTIEKFDPNKSYDAIIKPVIVCYEGGQPVYLKS
jgi:hypothetical protein